MLQEVVKEGKHMARTDAESETAPSIERIEFKPE